MSTNITSHNQSGGITAQTVNSDTYQENNRPIEAKSNINIWKIIGYIIGLVGLIGSIITIYSFVKS